MKFHQKGDITRLDSLLFSHKLSEVKPGWRAKVKSKKDGRPSRYDIFDEKGKKSSHIMGLTASPERRTGNQNDQLGLVFDAIIDCADIKTLIEDKVLVQPIYRPHFIHDLNLNNAEIKLSLIHI